MTTQCENQLKIPQWNPTPIVKERKFLEKMICVTSTLKSIQCISGLDLFKIFKHFSFSVLYLLLATEGRNCSVKGVSSEMRSRYRRPAWLPRAKPGCCMWLAVPQPVWGSPERCFLNYFLSVQSKILKPFHLPLPPFPSPFLFPHWRLKPKKILWQAIGSGIFQKAFLLK